MHSDLEVAVDLYEPGNTAAIGFRGGHLAVHGAQFIAADQPNKTAYWADINANRLGVHRNDTYQMARWVPLLEKAWARFGEVYGQYGEMGRGQGSGTSERSGRAGVGTQVASGYQAIESGVPGYVLNAFYRRGGRPGRQRRGHLRGHHVYPRFQSGAGQPGGRGPVAPIERGRCSQPGHQGADHHRQYQHRRYGGPPRRGHPRCYGRPRLAQRQTAHPGPAPARVLAAISRFNAATAGATTQAQRDAAKKRAGTPSGSACRRAVQPHQTWSLLERPGRSANLTAIVELMLDLVNIGTDHGGDQRNLYGDHSYAVLGFAPALTGGAPVPSPLPTGAACPTLLAQVDPDTSIVTLQNPHHGNEPDELGEGRPVRPGDGPLERGRRQRGVHSNPQLFPSQCEPGRLGRPRPHVSEGHEVVVNVERAEDLYGLYAKVLESAERRGARLSGTPASRADRQPGFAHCASSGPVGYGWRPRHGAGGGRPVPLAPGGARQRDA